MMTADHSVGGHAPAEPNEVKMSYDEALPYAVGILSRGHHKAAFNILEQLLDVMPDRAEVRHFYGTALHLTGSSEAGLREVDRSLEMEPTQANWWNNRGNVLRDLDRIDEAIDSYQRATELDPTMAGPYNNVGLIQRRRNNFDLAEACYKQAIKLDPNFADAHGNYGSLLVARGRMQDGITLLLQSITLRPRDWTTKRILAAAYGQLGETEKACAVYEEWLEQEPGNPRALHHISALRGQPSDRASDDYVRQVFDEFAASFDSKLASLDYRAPELVNAAVRRKLGALPAQRVIADAGCGTGLCGPGLRELASTLVGVDLSSGMLARAGQRGCYDELVEGELRAFLDSQSSVFDVVISADTLCYFGELKGVFAAAARSLKPGGVLVFTVEELPHGPPDIKLQHHGRYAHAQCYVERMLSEAGFQIDNIEHVALRQESAVDVAGLLVTATSPTVLRDVVNPDRS